MGGFNTSLLPIGKLSRQKSKQRDVGVKSNGASRHLQNIYPNAKEYTIFSAAHRTVSKMATYLDTKQVVTDIRKPKQLPAAYQSSID